VFPKTFSLKKPLCVQNSAAFKTALRSYDGKNICRDKKMVADITIYQRIRRARPGIQESESRNMAIQRIVAGSIPR
jgi:hypothetical protein